MIGVVWVLRYLFAQQRYHPQPFVGDKEMYKYICCIIFHNNNIYTGVVLIIIPKLKHCLYILWCLHICISSFLSATFSRIVVGLVAFLLLCILDRFVFVSYVISTSPTSVFGCHQIVLLDSLNHYVSDTGRGLPQSRSKLTRNSNCYSMVPPVQSSHQKLLRTRMKRHIAAIVLLLFLICITLY